MTPSPLILASSSPRRGELLRQLGVSFNVDPAQIDETVHNAEPADDYVLRMARNKAAVVAHRYRLSRSCRAVLAADTSVVVDDDILGKPDNADHAKAMLMRLSGRWHRVLTAVCIDGDSDRQWDCLVETQVKFCSLNDSMIRCYLATDEPWDKAGAYGIQGLAGALVERIDGSYSNVVGLPLMQTNAVLTQAGIATGLNGMADE